MEYIASPSNDISQHRINTPRVSQIPIDQPSSPSERRAHNSTAVDREKHKLFSLLDALRELSQGEEYGTYTYAGVPAALSR